ncbi:hypothetical protein CBS101457_000025 [Exobasidium rhododendri]|nr:hypothetical protein CBS101457_000025 [Exobasidium rhododendri]
MAKQTIGDFLIRRLEEVRVHHIFGVPGDFSLEFAQQVEDTSAKVEWIGTCNELNGSYAADAYARLNGLSVLCVTNGVGPLSAINGVAGSFAEHVPVICIAGTVPRSSIAQGRLMHHTMCDIVPDTRPLQAFQHYTVAQAQLTQQNAVAEIDRLILAAWQEKRPVYLELPSDVAFLQVEVPKSALQLHYSSGDAERVYACAKAVLAHLEKASRPALLLDIDADRYGVLDAVTRLAEKASIPVAVVSTVKGLFPEEHPLSLGGYRPGQAEIEGSDCLIAIGYRQIDSTSGGFTAKLPSNTIHLSPHSGIVADQHYEAVNIVSVLEQIASTCSARPLAKEASGKRLKTTSQITNHETLCQADYWSLLEPVLRPDDVLVIEEGTSMAGTAAFTLPKGCAYVSQPVWGSIGYSLGALLGTLIAAPERRHILFIGDGSFQLVAQELSTMIRHGLNPIIFLINNGGYTIERAILGAKAKYNDVANWRYAELPRTFGAREDQYESHVVKTAQQLQTVLKNLPSDKMVFVESIMAHDDSPPALVKAAHQFADIDYGVRGPQSRPGAQLTL